MPGPQLKLKKVIGRLPNASNTTLLANDSRGDPWVYKPIRGERPLWDFPQGTLALREVATYRADLAMGLGIVPETILADGPFGPGSAQRFITEDTRFDPRPMFTGDTLDRRLWPFAVLDLVTNNADRKVGHLLKQHGEPWLWAIDNGLTFHREPKLRTVLWGFAGEPLPAELTAAVGNLAADDSFWEWLSRHLSTDEVTATHHRVETLLADPIHPHPPDDRPPVPWPVW